MHVRTIYVSLHVLYMAHKHCGEVAFCPLAVFVLYHVFLCLIEYHSVDLRRLILKKKTKQKNGGEVEDEIEEGTFQQMQRSGWRAKTILFARPYIQKKYL